MGIAERKQREKEQRRQHILQVAETIFLEKGINSSTMDEIAAVCELSKGTLYLYFKSKEELFLQIMVSIMTDFVNLIEDNLKRCRSLEERINCLGESYLEFYRKYPNTFYIMNCHEDHPEDSNHFRSSENDTFQGLDRIWQVVESVLQEGIDAGIFNKECKPFEIGVMIWASSNGMIRLMDHIKRSHSCSNQVNNKCENPRFCSLTETDYESMLRRLWVSIIDSIRIKDIKQEKR